MGLDLRRESWAWGFKNGNGASSVVEVMGTGEINHLSIHYPWMQHTYKNDILHACDDAKGSA